MSVSYNAFEKIGSVGGTFYFTILLEKYSNFNGGYWKMTKQLYGMLFQQTK